MLNTKGWGEYEDEEEAEEISTALGSAQLYTKFAGEAAERGVFTIWADVTDAEMELAGLFLLNRLAKNEKASTFIICSGGGSTEDAAALMSVMEVCKAQGMTVRIFGVGLVGSAAFDIFIAGSRGFRYTAETTIFMTHSSSAEMRDKSLFRLREHLDEWTLETYTGINKRVREKFLETGNWYFDAQTAKAYRAVDHILLRGEKLPWVS